MTDLADNEFYLQLGRLEGAPLTTCRGSVDLDPSTGRYKALIVSATTPHIEHVASGESATEAAVRVINDWLAIDAPDPLSNLEESPSEA